MAIAHADGEYLARLETKTRMDALIQQMFIDENRGKTFKTEEERDLAFKEFRDNYYRSIPSASTKIFGMTRASFQAFRSAVHHFTNFEEPDNGVKAASETIVKSGLTNALLKAMAQDTSALKTTQSGQELIKGVIARDAKIRFTTTHGFAVYGNMAEQKRAFENIAKHGGKFMNFDVEDIGDYITQYAFADFDPSQGKTLNVVQEHVRAGMVGLNKQAHDAAMALIDEYEKHGLARNGKLGVSKDKEYMLREFMKMGLAGDNAWSHEENGRIKLLKYAANEDATVFRVDTMRKGVEELFKINQAATQQTFDFHGHQMYRYEIDAAESFMRAAKNGGLTLTSTNGLFHDIPMFEKMFGRNGFASAGAKAWFQEFTHGTGTLGNFINHLDVTSVGRELVGDDFVLAHPEAAAEAYRRGEYFNSSTGNQLSYLGKDGMAKAAQEAEELLGGAGQKHTALADVFMQGSTMQAIFKDWANIDKDFVNSDKNKSGRTDISIFGRAGKEHTAKKGQLFYINDGQFAKNSSGFSFMYDAISGEYRLSNNTRIGKNAKGDIVTTGIKKNTVAMLLGTPKELSFEGENGEKLLQAAKDAGFDPSGMKLYAASFAIYGEQKYNGHRNVYTFVGTKEEVQRFLQQNLYAGEFSKESIKEEIARQIEQEKHPGQRISNKQVSEESKQEAEQLTADWTEKEWREAALDEKNARAVKTDLVDWKTKKRLSTEIAGKDGKPRPVFSPTSYLKRSKEVVTKDSAGNWIRDMNYKKASRVLEFLDIYTKFSTDFFGFDSEVERAQNRSKIADVIFKAFKDGGTYGSTPEQQKAYKALTESLGTLMKTGEEYALYSNTLKQLNATVGWADGMRDVLSATTKKAVKIAGTDDKDVLEDTFQQVYQNTLANLTLRANEKFNLNLDAQDAQGKGRYDYTIDLNGKLIKTERSLPRTGEQINSFEVDVTKILQRDKLEKQQGIGSDLGNKFVIDLEKEESFGKRLARQLGMDPDRSEVTALRMLSQTIYDQYSSTDKELKKRIRFLQNHEDEAYTPGVMAANIRKGLHIIRNYSKGAGRVDGVTLVDTEHAPTAVRLLQQDIDHDKNLTPEQAAQKKQALIDEAVEESSKDITKIEARKKPKQLASEVVDLLFEKTEGVKNEDLQKYGYTKEEAKEILADRTQRKKETQKLLEVIFGKTYGTHGDMGYMVDGDDHVFLTMDDMRQLDITKYLPKDYFDEKNGSFRTLIGGRSLATTKMLTWDLSEQGRIPSLGIHSIIGLYAKNLEHELGFVNSPRRSTEEDLRNVDFFIRKALDPVVDKAVTKFDKQDTKLGQYLDLSTFYNRLGLYNAQGAFNDVWNDLSKDTQIALRSMTARLQKEQAENPDKIVDEIAPKTQELISIYNDFHRLISPLSNANSTLSSLVFAEKDMAEDFAKNYADRINLIGLKHPEKGLVSLTRSGNEAFSEFGTDPRHIGSVLSRAHDLQNVDEFRKLLGRDKGLGETTHLDSIVLTPEETAQRENGKGALRAVRTTHLTMNQTQWEKLLGEVSVQEKLERELGTSVTEFHAFLNESGSLINGALLDLGKKNIEQKMRTDELVDIVKMADIIGKDATKQEEEIRQRTNELIEVIKNKVDYKYSTDYVVLDKGEKMAWNESFKGTPTDRSTEREGLLKKRYYDKNGEEVSEEKINEVLSRKENLEIMQATQAAQQGQSKAVISAHLRAEADKILQREGYQQYYALESPDALPTRKVLLGTEKSMARFGMPPIGQMPGSRVAGILGLPQEELKEKLPFSYLTGSVIRDRDKLNALLEHHGIQRLDKGKFQELGKAVEEDQQHFWKTLNDVLHDQGVVAKDVNVNAISATEFEAAKGSHSEVGRMRTRINESVDILARARAAQQGHEVPNAEDYKFASTQIKNDLDEQKVFTTKDGKSVLSDAKIVGNESFSIGRPDIINVDSFNRVMAKYNPDFVEAYGKDENGKVIDGNVIIGEPPKDGGVGKIKVKVGDTYQEIDGPYTYDKAGNIVAKTGVTEMRFADDADEGRLNAGDSRGLKVTRRTTTALEQELYNAPSIEKAYNSIVALEKNLGKDAYDAEKHFNEMYRGIASAKRNEKGELELQIAKDADGKNVNDAIIQNLHEEVIAGPKISMQIVSGNDTQNDRIYKELEKSGIKRSDAEKIVSSLNKQGYSRVGIDTIKNQYAYTTGHLANRFNEEMADAVSDTERQGILDKYLGYGMFGDRAINIENVHFEKQASGNDLNNLTERAGIVKVNDRYVAVGYEPTSIMDNDNNLGTHDTTATRNALAEVQHTYTKRLPEIPNKEQALRELDDNIDNLIEAQGKSVTSKGGALARTGEGYLPESGMFKANIIRFRNGEAEANEFTEHGGEATKAVSKNKLLREAKVDGLSIAEHEALGHHVNAMFVGEDFFRNMAENEDFTKALEASLGRPVTQEDKDKALQNILRQASTKGGTGIELRQPMEYFDSVQGMHIFYDPTLSKNQALITEAAAKGQKADQDGDTIFAHATRADATIRRTDANGNEVVTHARLNQLQAASLNAAVNGNKSASDEGYHEAVTFDDGGKTFQKIDRASDTVANVSTSGVRPMDEGNDFKDTFWGKNGYENLKVNGKMYNAAAYSSSEIVNQEDKMKNIIGSDRFQNFVSRRFGIDLKNDEDETTQKFKEDLKHNLAEYEVKGDDGKKESYHIADEYIKDLKKKGFGDEAREAQEAFGVSFSNMANADEIAKTAARGNAGINNMNTYRFHTIINDLQANGKTAFQSGDNMIVSHVLEHMNDAFQAPKNSTSANQIDFRELGQAMEDFFGARDGRRNTQPLYDILGKMYDSGIKELKNLPQMEGLETNGSMISKERMLQAFDRVLQDGEVLNSVVWKQQRVGYAESEVDGKYASHNANDIKSASDKVMNSLLEEHGAEEHKLMDAPLTVASRSVAARQTLFDDDNHDHFMDAAAEDAEAGLEDTIKGTFRSIGKALNHGGAKAMLGFAGAMMMAGMAGGAPTSPRNTQTQAQGIQSENAMYEIPSTMPSGPLGRTQPQAYIINVNASTDRGRDFATQAISQAMAGMPQTSNGNQLTMNVKDSSSNISFGDIGNYVSSML